MFNFSIRKIGGREKKRKKPEVFFPEFLQVFCRPSHFYIQSLIALELGSYVLVHHLVGSVDRELKQNISDRAKN